MSYSSIDFSPQIKESIISLGPFSLGWEDKTDNGKDLKKLCSEFEAIFLTHLLHQMHSSLPGSDFLGNGIEGKITKWLWSQTLAQKMVEGGGIGLKKILYEELNEKAKRRRVNA